MGLMKSGVELDIVEIDPAVYHFAVGFFGLRGNHHIHFTDGAKYIEEFEQEEVYDFVLHDVFSGGFVPESLFSVEILEKVGKMLKKDGVLALVTLFYFSLFHSL